nr:uncharacterized protein LOC109421744 [Aedes albopictus]
MTIIIILMNQVHDYCDISCDKTRVEPTTMVNPSSIEVGNENTDKLEDHVVAIVPDIAYYDGNSTDPNLTNTRVMITAANEEMDLYFQDNENDLDDDAMDQGEQGIRQYWERYRERSGHTRNVCSTVRRLLERLRDKRGGTDDDYDDSESLVSFVL